MQHIFYAAGISAAKTLKSYIKQGFYYIYKAVFIMLLKCTFFFFKSLIFRTGSGDAIVPSPKSFAFYRHILSQIAQHV